jgi:hypothetical protein
MVAGGLLMTALFVPFTLTHGPTSFNEERRLLGHDMLFWGLLLGVVPNVFLGVGFWRLRDRAAGVRRVTRTAITAMVGALVVSAAMDLGFRGLGAPFMLFVLAPAAAVGAATLAPRGPEQRRVRRVLGVLAAVLLAGLAVALVPIETSDAFGGYRIFGLLVYAAAGLIWAWLGFEIAISRSQLGGEEKVG